MRLRLLKWIMKEAQAIEGDEVAHATAGDEPAELVRASQIVNTDVRHLEMQPSNGKKEERGVFEQMERMQDGYVYYKSEIS